MLNAAVLAAIARQSLLGIQGDMSPFARDALCTFPGVGAPIFSLEHDAATHTRTHDDAERDFGPPCSTKGGFREGKAICVVGKGDGMPDA